MNKKTKARRVSTAKYGGSSGVIGVSLTVILVYLISLVTKVTIPENVVIALTALITFVTNIVLSESGIISEE